MFATDFLLFDDGLRLARRLGLFSLFFFLVLDVISYQDGHGSGFQRAES